MIPARTNTTIHASGRNLKARRSPAPARACRDRAAAKAAAARRLRPRAPAERAGLRARLPWKGGPPRRGARNQEGLTKHHLCRRRRAARPQAVSSVAPNASAFRMTRGSLRPCLGTTSASRRRVTFRQTLLELPQLVRELARLLMIPCSFQRPDAAEEVAGSFTSRAVGQSLSPERFQLL